MWPLIMGGLGLAKMVQDNVNQSNEAKRRAAEQQFSPWTHQGASTEVGQPGGVGSVLQGAGAGMQMQQAKQFGDDLHDWMSRGYSPYGLGNGPGPVAIQGPAAMAAGTQGAGPLAFNPYAQYGI